MVAGGTGGHIYPAIALAEKLIEKGNDVSFIGSNNRMEKDIIPASGFKYTGLDVLSTSGNIIDKFKSIISMIGAYFKCLKLLKGTDLVIGFGNYISVPVLLAALKLKIKTAIHEQNSFVGKANKFLDTRVDLVIGSYKENLKQFKNPNTFILGNPQSAKALNIKEDKNVIKNLGLDPKKKTVVIFMGSLGSATVTKVMMDFFKLLDGSYQVVYATGSSYYKEVREKCCDTEYLKIFERIDGINVMKNADLLVSRAGATTLAEVSAIGIPTILIPSPFVPNNHQYFNGLALVEQNAAIMLEEKDLTSTTLKNSIDSIIDDDVKLKQLHDNAIGLANKNVMEDIISKLESIC